MPLTVSLTSADSWGGKGKLGADHTVFIVHSFTNVQNKNQTIKGKTSELGLLLAALFFPGSSACSSWILQQSHATVPTTEPLFLRCQVSHQQDVARCFHWLSVVCVYMGGV